jgi:hypothetical protein
MGGSICGSRVITGIGDKIYYVDPRTKKSPDNYEAMQKFKGR